MKTFKKVYHRKKTTSQYWLNKSSDLRASAGIIWLNLKNEKNIVKKLGLGAGFSLSVCYPTFELLCGLSLELIFKAVIVANGKHEVPNSHSLSSLAKLADLDYIPEIQKLLDVLSESVIWFSKYPIPTKPKTMVKNYYLRRNYFFDSKKIGSLKIFFGKNHFDWKIFNNIWEKAYNKIIKEPKK